MPARKLSKRKFWKKTQPLSGNMFNLATTSIHAIKLLVQSLPHIVISYKQGVFSYNWKPLTIRKGFHGQPDYNIILNYFGLAYYLYLKADNRHKFDFHSNNYIFIEYRPYYKGFYACISLVECILLEMLHLMSMTFLTLIIDHNSHT